MSPNLSEFNRAWLERRYDDLDALFDDNVVIRGPGFALIGRGRAACVESYRQFMSSADVSGFETSDEAVDTWGDTAAITYNWTITYSQGGAEAKRESGHEMLVFTLQGGRWKVVSRVILF